MKFQVHAEHKGPYGHRLYGGAGETYFTVTWDGPGWYAGNGQPFGYAKFGSNPKQAPDLYGLGVSNPVWYDGYTVQDKG